MNSYNELIIEILKEVNPYEEIEMETDLEERGILNSLTLMYLITELEDNLDIVIPENEIKPERFCSIKEIEGLIRELSD